MSSSEIDNPAAYFAMDFSVDSLEDCRVGFSAGDRRLEPEDERQAQLIPGSVIDFAASFPDDGGFKVNTEHPNAPVILAFESFLVNVEIVGEMRILANGAPIAEMLGTFYLETDGSSFKIFATADLLVGTDIGSPSNEPPLLDVEQPVGRCDHQLPGLCGGSGCQAGRRH